MAVPVPSIVVMRLEVAITIGMIIVAAIYNKKKQTWIFTFFIHLFLAGAAAFFFVEGHVFVFVL